MKITNAEELRDTVTKLTTQIDAPSTSVSSKMDAAEINNFFESVEEALNTMYEKLRLLQDLYDFSREYIQFTFAQAQEDIKIANADSDDSEKEYRNSRVRACTVVASNACTARDRDGSALYQADVNGSTIIPGNAILEDAEPSSTSILSTEVCYRRISNPAKSYKSFYVMDDASAELPKEKVMFFLPVETMLNHIDISAFNSNVESAVIICSNGERVPVEKGDTTFAERNVIAIEIIFKADKRDKVVLEISDKSSTFSSTESAAITDTLDNVWDTYLAQKGDILYHVLR